MFLLYVRRLSTGIFRSSSVLLATFGVVGGGRGSQLLVLLISRSSVVLNSIAGSMLSFKMSTRGNSFSSTKPNLSKTSDPRRHTDEMHASAAFL